MRYNFHSFHRRPLSHSLVGDWKWVHTGKLQKLRPYWIWNLILKEDTTWKRLGIIRSLYPNLSSHSSVNQIGYKKSFLKKKRFMQRHHLVRFHLLCYCFAHKWIAFIGYSSLCFGFWLSPFCLVSWTSAFSFEWVLSERRGTIPFLFWHLLWSRLNFLKGHFGFM